MSLRNIGLIIPYRLSLKLLDISTYSGIIATKSQEQANLYNIHFYSVFCKESLGTLSILVHNIQNDQFAN